MSSKVLAHRLISLGLIGLGVLSLLYGDFAMVWQPVPQGIPFRTPLAYLSGALLLAGGVGMLVRSVSVRAAAVIAWFLFSWLVLLQFPKVMKAPADVGAWLGVGETLVLVTGSWSMFLLLKLRAGEPRNGFLSNDNGLRTARLFFGMALPIIGLSHFVYVDATAGMVPAWLPARKAFAYLTGAGHMAAGLGLLLGIFPRLAATMEAIMISCFVVLLHAPGVVAAPHDRLQWTMLSIAIVLNGCCWAIAGTFAEQRWLATPGPARARITPHPAAVT
jgi:uncharacterized membrane protein